MPTFCPHCNKLVAEQPRCPNCGKRMHVPESAEGIDRQTMFILMRYALMWTVGIVGVGFLCLAVIYILLS